MDNSVYAVAVSRIANFFPDHDDIEHATLDSIHIDSFVLIQMMLDLESTFGIEFEDATFESGAFATIQEIALYVEKRVINGSGEKPLA